MIYIIWVLYLLHKNKKISPGIYIKNKPKKGH